MRILHYTIGLYPRRAGGLNHYATDLMMAQANEHEITVLLPGGWTPWSKSIKIFKSKCFYGIQCYNIQNAMPLPLLYGIRRPNSFVAKKCDYNSLELFFDEVKPDVLHLHTLMGMPECLLHFFKEKGVRIVYTSHDYFGICPKVNLINQQGELCVGPAPERCAACNMQAPSTLFLRLRNSGIAFKTRDIVRWLMNTLHF